MKKRRCVVKKLNVCNGGFLFLVCVDEFFIFSMKNDINRSKEYDIMEELKRTERNKAKEKELYEKGLALMASPKYSDYEFASLIFESISGYKDSDELLEQCRVKIKNAKHELAKELIGENTIDSLERAQYLLKDWDKEDALVKECNAALISLRYQEAQDLFSNHEYEEALDLFRLTPDYQDSNSYIEQCENMLNSDEPKSKGGKVVGILLTLILLAAIGVGGWFGYQYFKTPKLVVNVVEIEYGEEVKLEPKLFISDDSKNIDMDSITLVTDLTTNTDLYTYDKSSKVVVSKDKEYLEIGSYDVEIKSKKNGVSATTSLVIKDTKAPTIECSVEKFEYTIGSQKIDFASYFKTEDKSEVKVEFNTDSIDWNTEGTYQVKAIATDAQGNKSEKVVDVEIKQAAYEEPAYTYEEPVYQEDDTTYTYQEPVVVQEPTPTPEPEVVTPEPTVEPTPDPIPDPTDIPAVEQPNE